MQPIAEQGPLLGVVSIQDKQGKTAVLFQQLDDKGTLLLNGVYAVRPRQCRTWPFWESNLATPEAWRHACTVCPGSGQGELIPAEEITRRLKVIRM